MGCCLSTEKNPEKLPNNTNNHNNSNPVVNHLQQTSGIDTVVVGGFVSSGGVPAFAEFSFADLKAATNNFSSEFIVSESGEKAPNVVYKGHLKNQQWIAVKKFTKLAWPDPKQFAVFISFNLVLFVGFV